jgi:multisite-specific tRNA:(cytosine-C5)-methyltransferase
MLPKEDRSAMLLRIYNDTTPLINMGIQKDKKEATAAPAAAAEGGEEKDADMKDAAAAPAAEVQGEAEASADVEVVDAPAAEVEAEAAGAAPTGEEPTA